jgi:DNA transposition AAA+ family ATPase
MSDACNESTMSDILNRKWVERNHISVKIWNKLSAFLKINTWQKVPTTTSTKYVFNICKHVRRFPQALAIIGEPGTSKSESLKMFTDSNKGVFYLECASFWTRKVFLNECLRALGESEDSTNINEMFRSVVDSLKRKQRPLLIIDEADKLKDGVIDLFNAMYNETLNHAAYILAGAPYLEKRIEKGRRLNRQSYKEIHSRVGGEYHRMKEIKAKDIDMICKANGVDNPEDVQAVINPCNGDLRRVKNIIEKIKIANENEND